MTEPSTIEKLAKLKAQIEALSPAARLLMASQIWKADPELAVTLADNVVMEFKAAKLLGRIPQGTSREITSSDGRRGR
jgi:hypothetical protein